MWLPASPRPSSCDDIIDSFSDGISQIIDHIAPIPVIYPVLPHILIKWLPEAQEVIHQLKSLLDLIPTKLFKSVSHYFTNNLVNMVNKCLQSGFFKPDKNQSGFRSSYQWAKDQRWLSEFLSFSPDWSHCCFHDSQDSVGLVSRVRDCLSSYLKGGRLIVSISSYSSWQIKNVIGVLQGSVFGPPLFNLYMLHLILSYKITIYADDKVIFITFYPVI